MSDQYIYGFVRRDLPPVQRIIQFGHACVEVGLDLGTDERKAAPLSPPNICLFEVADEDELIAVVRQLRSARIKHSAFYERDYDVGFSAVATEPISGDARSFFANFKRYED